MAFSNVFVQVFVCLDAMGYFDVNVTLITKQQVLIVRNDATVIEREGTFGYCVAVCLTLV